MNITTNLDGEQVTILNVTGNETSQSIVYLDSQNNIKVKNVPLDWSRKLTFATSAESSILDTSVYTDFTMIPNGPIPFQHDQTKLPIRTKYPEIYGGVPLVVSGGRLQSLSENPGLTVCYTETDFFGDVTEIGADISFLSRGGGPSTIALCLWDSSLVDTYTTGGKIPETGCHFIIQRDYWAYQVWEPILSGTQTQLRTISAGVMPNIPVDGSIFRINISFDKASAKISFPKFGYSIVISDHAIYDLGRRYACWETYQGNSSADKPQFARIWASKTPFGENTKNSEPFHPQVFATKSLTDGNYTITSAHSEIDTNTYCDFIVPPSGKVLLEYTCLLSQASAGYVMFFLASTTIAGADWSYPLVQQTDAIFRGTTTVKTVVSGLKPGEQRRFRPRVFTSSTTTASIIRATASGISPTLVVTQL